MSEEEQGPLIEPDPSFAEQWSVDDPVAQGALKFGAVAVPRSLRWAAEELGEARPDLGDFGPLAIFPPGLRPALTPLLVEKLHAAAVVVGWKLAQPGPPIPPVCLAEEFALELIRREAVEALALEEAAEASIDATRGVYEVCEDDDVLDLFLMREPADAALALESPIHQQMGKADMRIEHWFDLFYRGKRGALHPLYLRSERISPPDTVELPLEVVEPSLPLDLDRRPSGSEFRVILRYWDDGFVDRHPVDQMPATWIYYLQAETAEAALKEVLERFPDGATREFGIDPTERSQLDGLDLARISFDIQRVNLAQSFSEAVTFHVVGTTGQTLNDDQLGRFAATLGEVFPEAVVLRDTQSAFFGIAVNAEGHEEAEANVDEFLAGFAEAAGLPEDLAGGMSVGQGRRRGEGLNEEVERYRESDLRPGS